MENYNIQFFKKISRFPIFENYYIARHEIQKLSWIFVN